MALPRFCSNCAAPLPSPPPVTCRACDTSHWLDAKPCAGALVTRRGQADARAPRARALAGRLGRPGRLLRAAGAPRGRRGPRGARGDRPRRAGGRHPRDVDRHLRARGTRGADKVTLNIYFHATAEGAAEARTDPNEVAEIGWFAPDELPGELAFPGHVPAVLRAWRDSLEPAPRAAAPALRAARLPASPSRPSEPRRADTPGERPLLPRPARLPRPAPPRRRPRRRRGRGRPAPRGRRDPPPRHRRRRPRAPLHERRAAPTSRWSPTSSAPRAAPSSPSAAGRAGSSSGSSSWPRRCCRRPPASSGARATSAARRCASGSPARRARAGDRGRDAATSASTACRRSPAGRRTAARSSPCRSSTPSTPTRPAAPTSACTACRSTTRATTGMHWQIGKGGGFHYAVAEAPGRGAARHGLPRRPAGAHPRRDRAAARERARADARLAPRRARRLRALPGPGRAPARGRAPSSRSSATCRPRVRRPEGPFGDHYGYYSLRHDYPVFEVETALPPARRDLPGDRRRQAAPGGLLHRRPAAGAALAALPAGDAGRRRPLVLRRDRLPLARRRGRAASATGARRWPRPSASSARGSSR